MHSSTPETSSQPIGVFDSGLGGLTVLRALCESLPHENFIYLGDTARLPYGTKSPTTIRRYLEQNVAFLRGLQVKALVVACNSASSVLTVDDRNQMCPLYGVIQPGAERAHAVTQNRRIGVIATKATVSRGAYTESLQQLSKELTVFQQACPLLVPLVEEGWIEDPLTNLVVHRYLAPLLEKGVDTLILGCTHYPVLRGSIARVAGPSVTLVDSAQTLTDRLASDIQQGHVPENSQRAQGEVRLLTTDVAPGFLQIAQNLMQPIPVGTLELIDLVQTPARS